METVNHYRKANNLSINYMYNIYMKSTSPLSCSIQDHIIREEHFIPELVCRKFVCGDVYDKHKFGEDFRGIAFRSVLRRILVVTSFKCG